MEKKVYLDYAASTPVDKKIIKKILPYFAEKFGNTSSLHQWGISARTDLENARQVVADSLEAKTNEIIFTSSATESNNLALKGIAWAYRKKGKHILISAIEHDSVKQPAQWLKKQGYEIEEIPVDKEGFVKSDRLKAMIKPETILVSIIYTNNEIGTIQNIKEIAQICHQKNTLLHTDAAQALGKIPVSTKEGFDLLTASSHKIYGPKGAALLYVKTGVRLEPLLHGGKHEFGLRGSSVNVGAIIGFAEALKTAQKNFKLYQTKIKKLRDFLVEEVLKIPGANLTGPSLNKPRAFDIASFYFEGIEGESLVSLLDQYGIAASTGSACSSEDLKPSPVLLACGFNPVQAHGSLRLSLGKENTKKDIEYTIKILRKAVKKLRAISPYA